MFKCKDSCPSAMITYCMRACRLPYGSLNVKRAKKCQMVLLLILILIKGNIFTSLSSLSKTSRGLYMEANVKTFFLSLEMCLQGPQNLGSDICFAKTCQMIDARVNRSCHGTQLVVCVNENYQSRGTLLTHGRLSLFLTRLGGLPLLSFLVLNNIQSTLQW